MIIATDYRDGLWVIDLLIGNEPEQVVSKRSYLEALSLALKLIFVHRQGAAA